MTLALRPCTIRAARAFVRASHRHHPLVTGALFAASVARGGEVVGVVLVGRPVARALDNGAVAEITRCCTDGAPNACSMLYGAARRAAFALGYERVITYTLEGEPGTSLRAAGFVRDGVTKGGAWDTPARRRRRREGLAEAPKVRWSCRRGAA